LELKDRPTGTKKEGAAEQSAVKPGNGRVVINRRRLLNVLFGDIVRPHLATLGTSLSREDLDSGKKIDQQFHEMVAVEYNKTGVSSYDENAFPFLSSGRIVPPSNYQNIDWKKSRESFKALTNEYDICFKNWKLSGFHGDIPTDVQDMTEAADKPFSDFANKNISVQYMHQFVYQFPDILSTVTGDLPDHLFFNQAMVRKRLSTNPGVQRRAIKRQRRRTKVSRRRIEL
jgi:hypothetical protein